MPCGLQRRATATVLQLSIESNYVQDSEQDVIHGLEESTDGACQPYEGEHPAFTSGGSGSSHPPGEKLCGTAYLGSVTPPPPNTSRAASSSQYDAAWGTDLELQWHSQNSATSPRICGPAGAWVIQAMRPLEDSTADLDFSIRRHLRAWACGVETGGPAGLNYPGGGPRTFRPLFWHLCRHAVSRSPSGSSGGVSATVTEQEGRQGECAEWEPYGELEIDGRQVRMPPYSCSLCVVPPRGIDSRLLS